MHPANAVLQNEMKRLRVKQYRVAENEGENEGTLCRRLRKPLPLSHQFYYLNVIYGLAEDDLGEGSVGEGKLRDKLGAIEENKFSK